MYNIGDVQQKEKIPKKNFLFDMRSVLLLLYAVAVAVCSNNIILYLCWFGLWWCYGHAVCAFQ